MPVLCVTFKRKDNWKQHRLNVLTRASEEEPSKSLLVSTFPGLKRLFKNFLSPDFWGLWDGSLRPCRLYFFKFKLFLLMCKHLKEDMDFTWTKGSRTSSFSESFWTRILQADWMGGFDKKNLWTYRGITFDTERQIYYPKGQCDLCRSYVTK